MTPLRPLDGYVVAPDVAAEVVAPAYDVLTPQQRRSHAVAQPLSFLSVLPAEEADGAPTRAEEQAGGAQDGAEGQSGGDDLAAARQRLQDLVARGVFRPWPRPFLAVYRLADGNHVQTGLVGDLPVSAIRDGTVKPHERTRPARVAQLVRFLAEVGVASSPASLTFRADQDLRAALAHVTARAPHRELADPGGVRQALWIIEDPGEVAALAAASAGVGALYITDGHHRVAAADRYARRSGAGKDDPAACVLVVLFPHDELRVLGHDRAITGVGEDAAARLREAASGGGLDLRAATAAERPLGPGRVRVRHAAGSFEVAVPAGRRPGAPVSELAVAFLHDEVLPLLGIVDTRTDWRLTSVPRLDDGETLDELLRRGDADLTFEVPPPSIADLMEVADAGQTMPPKSTFFVPKVRSGLLLRFRKAG